MTSCRLRRRLTNLIIAGSFAIAGGVVFAQNSPDAPPKPAKPAKSGVTVTSTIKVEAPKISAAEMSGAAAEYQGKMKEVLKRIVRLQDVARSQKDVIKLNCVNDKLLQVKQLLNIADTASNNLQEAIARNDDDTRGAEYERLSISDEQVTSLGGEAENCIGGDLIFLGPTQVTVDVPTESIDDPTLIKDLGVPSVDLPPVASPFV